MDAFKATGIGNPSHFGMVTPKYAREQNVDDGGLRHDRITRLRQAACRVLADDVLKRSPVMSHLLEYLVEMTAQNTPLKSYTIAIEALGKSGKELADADTHARVAVARLRKALAAYHAAHPGDDEIYIDSGSYEVHIRSLGPADAAPVPEQDLPGGIRQRLLEHVRTFARRYLAGGLALLVLASVSYLLQARNEQRRWTTLDFPTLAVEPGTAAEGGRPPLLDQDLFKNVLRERLKDYMGFRLIEAGRVQADYEIRLDLDVVDGAKVETVALVETATQRLLWSSRYEVNDAADLDRSTILAATALVAPGGALNRFGQRKMLPSRTPYGCWLLFTQYLQSLSTNPPRELFRCTERWYANDNTSRHAAFLRNWTLVNESVTLTSPSARQAAVQEALTVVHQALARHPDTALLYIAEMRTHSFLGARDAVRQAAQSAVANAPDNRLIVGLTGSWLTFWNDPQGASLLAQLDDSPGIALPWENAGHFIAAMMQDDVQGAGEQLGPLRIYMAGQPALKLMEAAHAGRSGMPRRAQAALDDLRNRPRVSFAGPEEVMDRLPFAPEVKKRMEEWISYQPTRVAAE